MAEASHREQSAPLSKNERIKALEERIAELKARFPAHSSRVAMWRELEDLEEELEKAQREEDAKETGAG